MTETLSTVAAQLPQTLVLWDVDHTLIENGGVSKETYVLAFELLTGQMTAVRPVTDGRTDYQIVRELFAANHVNPEPYVDQFDGALLRAMQKKAPELSQRGYALAGALEALQALAAVPSVVQSVLTGNISLNALEKLRPFGLDKWVDLDVGGYGSDDIVRARLVEAARRKVRDKYELVFDAASTILVGDTPLDIEAARDGGAKVIAVATGATSAATLRDSGADRVIQSLEPLDGFLDALVSVRTG